MLLQSYMKSMQNLNDMQGKSVSNNTQFSSFQNIQKIKLTTDHIFNPYLRKLQQNGVNIIQNNEPNQKLFKFEQASSASLLKDYQRYKVKFSCFQFHLETYSMSLSKQSIGEFQNYLKQVNCREYQYFPAVPSQKINFMYKASMHKILRILLKQADNEYGNDSQQKVWPKQKSIRNRKKQFDENTQNKEKRNRKKFDIIWDDKFCNVWIPSIAAKININETKGCLQSKQNLEDYRFHPSKIEFIPKQNLQRLMNFLSYIGIANCLTYFLIKSEKESSKFNNQQKYNYHSHSFEINHCEDSKKNKIEQHQLNNFNYEICVTMAMLQLQYEDSQSFDLIQNVLKPQNSVTQLKQNMLNYWQGKTIAQLQESELLNQHSYAFDILADVYLSHKNDSLLRLFDGSLNKVVFENFKIIRNLLIYLYGNIEANLYQSYRSVMTKEYELKQVNARRQKSPQNRTLQSKKSTKEKSTKACLFKCQSSKEKNLAIDKIQELQVQSEQSDGVSSLNDDVLICNDNKLGDFSADEEMETSLVDLELKKQQTKKQQVNKNQMLGVGYEYLLTTLPSESKNGRKLKQQIQLIKNHKENNEDKQQQNENECKQQANKNTKKKDQNAKWKKQLFLKIRKYGLKVYEECPQTLWQVGQMLLLEDVIMLSQFIRYFDQLTGNENDSKDLCLLFERFLIRFTETVYAHLEKVLIQHKKQVNSKNLYQQQVFLLNFALLLYFRFQFPTSQPNWKKIEHLSQNLFEIRKKTVNRCMQLLSYQNMQAIKEEPYLMEIYSLTIIHFNILYRVKDKFIIEPKSIEQKLKYAQQRNLKIDGISQNMQTNRQYIFLFKSNKQLKQQPLISLYYCVVKLQLFYCIMQFIKLLKFSQSPFALVEHIHKLICQVYSCEQQLKQKLSNQKKTRNVKQLLPFYLANSLAWYHYQKILSIFQTSPEPPYYSPNKLHKQLIITKNTLQLFFKYRSNLSLTGNIHYRNESKLLIVVKIFKNYKLSYYIFVILNREIKFKSLIMAQSLQKILDEFKIILSQENMKEFKEEKFIYCINVLYYVLYFTCNVPFLMEYRFQAQNILFQIIQMAIKRKFQDVYFATFVFIKEMRKLSRFDEMLSLIFIIGDNLISETKSTLNCIKQKFPQFVEETEKIQTKYEQILIDNLLDKPSELVTYFSFSSSQQFLYKKIYSFVKSQLSSVNYFNYYLFTDDLGKQTTAQECTARYIQNFYKTLQNEPFYLIKSQLYSLKCLVELFKAKEIPFTFNIAIRQQNTLDKLKQRYRRRLFSISVNVTCQLIRLLYSNNNQQWMDVLEEAFCSSVFKSKLSQYIVYMNYAYYLDDSYLERMMKNTLNEYKYSFVLGVEYLKYKKTDIQKYDAHLAFLKKICSNYRKNYSSLPRWSNYTIRANLHYITAEIYSLKKHRKSKMHYEKLQKYLISNYLVTSKFIQFPNIFHKIHRLYQKFSDEQNPHFDPNINKRRKRYYKSLCSSCSQNFYVEVYPKRVLSLLLLKFQRYQENTNIYSMRSI